MKFKISSVFPILFYLNIILVCFGTHNHGNFEPHVADKLTNLCAHLLYLHYLGVALWLKKKEKSDFFFELEII